MAGTDVGAERRTGSSPWLVFSLLAVVQFMVVLDGSIVVIALPAIQDDLGFSEANLSWVMDAYMLIFGGLLLIGGRAADLFGRRRLMFWGLTLFTVASLACAVATQPWHLVTARIAQGFGAAMVSPAALALVTDIFPEGKDRNKALGFWGGMGGIAGPAGILLGGVLTMIGWQWAFLINVPIGVAVLLLSGSRLPVSTTQGTGKMDAVGAALGTGGLCLLLFAALRGGVQGWGSAATLIEFALAALLLVGFVVRQASTDAPLVPRALLRLRTVLLGNGVSLTVGASLYAGFVLSALYLQQTRGLSPAMAAVTIIPLNLAMLVGSQISPRLLGRYHPATVLAGGLLVQTVALAWWALALSADGNLLTALVLPGMLWCLGLGVALVPVFVICTMGVTPDVAGAASGLVVTTNQIGGAMGIAVIIAVAAERVSMGGWHGPAAEAPRTLLAAAHSAALWGSVVIGVIGLLLALFLRRVRLGGGPSPQLTPDQVNAG